MEIEDWIVIFILNEIYREIRWKGFEMNLVELEVFGFIIIFGVFEKEEVEVMWDCIMGFVEEWLGSKFDLES